MEKERKKAEKEEEREKAKQQREMLGKGKKAHPFFGGRLANGGPTHFFLGGCNFNTMIYDLLDRFYFANIIKYNVNYNVFLL